MDVPYFSKGIGGMRAGSNTLLSILFPGIIILFFFFSGCRNQQEKEKGSTGRINELTDQEKKEGWILLFNGETFNNWRGIGMESIPEGWTIDNQAIKKIPRSEMPQQEGTSVKGGDLMSVQTYEDFELVWDWKISENGNSGIKYNVSEELSMSKSSGSAALGWEYQIIDDGLPGIQDKPTRQAGALYDMIPPELKATKLVGEYNNSRLIFRGSHGEHWLNGSKVVEYDMNTASFDSLFQLSKYRDIPGFKDKRRGHIVLQDHPGASWFRNIKIRNISPGSN